VRRPRPTRAVEPWKKKKKTKEEEEEKTKIVLIKLLAEDRLIRDERSEIHVLLQALLAKLYKAHVLNNDPLL
jgi:hypothetical protein